MGTNEFNSEPTPQQGDGDQRIADQRVEEPGSLLERVRAEQRELEVRVNSFSRAVIEFSTVVASIRQSRIQRIEERNQRIEEYLDPSRIGSSKVVSHTRSDGSEQQRANQSSQPEDRQFKRRGFSL